MSRRGILLAVAAGTIAAHLTALGAGFVQDDHLLVETNPVVVRGNLLEIFSAAYWEEVHPVTDRALWRPVPILSYAIERRIGGGPRAAVSHAVNVALHVAAALLVVALALRHGATAGAALAGALAFAVHPARSEAVFNVVGRAEILAAAFGISSLLLALRAMRGDGARARIAAWGGGVALLLALASKETAAVFVPLLALQDLLASRGARRAAGNRAWARAGALLPAAVAVAVFVVARTLALEAWFEGQPIQRFDNPLVDLDAAGRAPTALALVARQAALTVAPVRLSVDYSGGSVPIEASWLAIRPALGLVVAAVLALAALTGWRRRDRIGDLRVLGAAATALPALVTGNFLFPVGAIFAERFLYLPTVGLAFVVASVVRLPRSLPLRRAAVAAAAAVLLSWGTGTWLRGREWKSDATAFGSAARNNPGSPRAHYVVAKLAADGIQDPASEGAAVDAALARFDRAIALWDDYPEAWADKGALLARSGRLGEAERTLREAIRRGPGSRVAHFNLGLVLQRLGRPDEARRSFRHATLEDPAHAPSWASLGHLAFEAGRWDEAARAYERAVSLGRADLLPRLEESRRLTAQRDANRGDRI